MYGARAYLHNFNVSRAFQSSKHAKSSWPFVESFATGVLTFRGWGGTLWTSQRKPWSSEDQNVFYCRLNMHKTSPTIPNSVTSVPRVTRWEPMLSVRRAFETTRLLTPLCRFSCMSLIARVASAAFVSGNRPSFEKQILPPLFRHNFSEFHTPERFLTILFSGFTFSKLQNNCFSKILASLHSEKLW